MTLETPIPMTRSLERKLAGKCTRCGADAGDTNLCTEHQADANARTARSVKRTRRARRAGGLCAFCGRPSGTYRCGAVDCSGTPARTAPAVPAPSSPSSAPAVGFVGEPYPHASRAA